MKLFLYFLLFSLPFQIALNPAANIDLALGRVFIILGFSVWFTKNLLRKKIKLPVTNESLWLLFFLFLAGFSLIKAEELGWGMRKLLVFASIFPLYFLICGNFKKENVERIFKILSVSAFLAAVVGICQFGAQFIFNQEKIILFWTENIAPFFWGKTFSQAVIQHPSFWVNIGGKTYLRAFSFFPDPHMLAFFLGMVLPLSLALFLRPPKAPLQQPLRPLKPLQPLRPLWPLRLYNLYSFMALIILFCLFLTFSRGGYLGLIASGFFMLVYFLYRLKIKYRVLILGSAILLIVLFLAIMPIRTRLLSSFDLAEGSVAGRIKIWQEAYRIWLDHFWFGVGIGNYSYFLNPMHNYRMPVYAHNTYLDIAVEMGVLALVSWLLLFFFAFLKLFGALKLKIRNRKEKNPFLAEKSELKNLALLVSLIYFFVHAFFETPLYSPQILPLLMAILALVTIQTQKEKAAS